MMPIPFKFSLTQRFTFTTIAILMVVLLVNFNAYKMMYSKSTENLVKDLQINTEKSLQNQLYRRGDELGKVLSNNLFDAMYNYNIELVYQLMVPILAVEEVRMLQVVDKEALIFHDGKEHLELIAEPHPRSDLLLKAMDEHKQLFEFTPRGIIFAIPIMESKEVVGAIYMELSIDILAKDISQEYQAIEEIRKQDEDKFILIQILLSIFLMLFASLVVWIFVRNLNKPLNHLILELRNRNGNEQFVEISGELRSDEIGQLTRAYNEMGKKVNSHTAAIQKMVQHDSLTQLPNRHKFITHVQTLISNPDIENLSLFFIDLDEFKATNDNFGHATGDAMLLAIAKRLDELIKYHSLLNSGVGSFANNMVARIGGDEFLIAIVNSGESNEVLGELILNGLQSNLILSGHHLLVSGSVGISCYPTLGVDAETLIKQADIAMYCAKSQGKNKCRLFSQVMKLDAEYQDTIEQELKSALSDLSQFELWYQPKVSLATKQLIGAEALVRWNHPTRGYIFPDQFIPIAEKSDMIIHIGEGLILQLGEQIGQWQLDNKINQDFHVALNVSVRQIYRQNVIAILKKALHDNDLSPSRVHFEVTESLLLNDTKIVDEVLTSLQNIGITLWLDDFGTGYSSLSYLQSFNFDGVKVDRSFVQNIENNKKNQNLVKAILSLAKTLEIGLVVEGIETEEQATILQYFGCEHGQGYYYAKPLPKAEFEREWL